MSIRDHNPVVFDQFKGLYSRGANYNCPPAYSITCDNQSFPSLTEIEDRAGFNIALDWSGVPGVGASVERVWPYVKSPTVVFYLGLDKTNGKIYAHNGTVLNTTPILTINAPFLMTDFSVNIMFGNCYISPHDRSFGLNSTFLYMWNGVDATARRAAGTRPFQPDPMVVATGGTGKVELGDHLFAYAYETDSGFITKPGPYLVPGTPNYTLYAAPGGKQAVITGIQLAVPAGTAFKHILATKVIFSYNGNPEGYEYFFVPNGKLPANATGATVDFYDSDLVKSADYLFDNLSELPAGVALSTYSGRQVIIGPGGWTIPEDQVAVNGRQMWMSLPAQPESFNSVSGFVQNDDTSSGGFKNGSELRGVFYGACLSRMYQTRDTGQDPSSWPLQLVDAGYGSSCFGIAPIASVVGGNVDWLLIANKSGLFAFNGAFQYPPLSYVIDTLWNTNIVGNTTEILNLMVNIDPETRRIYVLSPITGGRILLMCDFKDGLDFNSVKWSRWYLNDLNTFIVNSMFVVFNLATFRTALYILSGTVAGGTIRTYVLNEAVVSPSVFDTIFTGSGTITSYVRAILRLALTSEDSDNAIYHICGTKIYTTKTFIGGSSQTSILNLYDQNDGLLSPLNTITIDVGDQSTSKWQSFDYKGERFSLEYKRANSIAPTRIRVQKIILFIARSSQGLPYQGV